MSYKAIITKITNLEPHPNADRLLVTKLSGYNVIVGLDSKIGDIVVLFPPDGQLSEEYAKENDLVGYTDEAGNKKGGFFDKTCRVKATRLRSMKSEAYVATLKSLEYTGYPVEKLVEGFQFDELNGKKICQKYYTPATQRAMKNRVKAPRKENPYFRKHIDTEQYKTCKKLIREGSVIYITEKLHGTSARASYLLDAKEVPFKWYEKWWNKTIGRFYNPIGEKEKIDFDYLVGSRNVTFKTDLLEKESEGMRCKAFHQMKIGLRKGETVYSELVGYDNEKLIMGSQSISKSSDKELKKYGDKMSYTYNCKQGEFEQYVYRITVTTADNHANELPYYQMKRRCTEMGLKTPPLLKEPFVFDGDYTKLDQIIEDLIDGPSILDPNHIREGVVIRSEMPNGDTSFLKSKSFEFLLLEGIIKNDDKYIDLEEIS